MGSMDTLQRNVLILGWQELTVASEVKENPALGDAAVPTEVGIGQPGEHQGIRKAVISPEPRLDSGRDLACLN